MDLLLIPNNGTSSGIRTHTVTILNRLPPTDWATEAYVGGLTGHFPLCTGYPTAASGGTFIECVRLQSPKPLYSSAYEDSSTYGLVGAARFELAKSLH